MKKYCFLVLSLFILSVLLTACAKVPNSTIKYERKLGKYFDTEKKSEGGFVDLSEGPKLKYNINLGPKDLNFDFKIEDPY